MTHTFTTLRHPVEKLLEAEHFLARLSVAQGLAFQFELNAFLSACRSVTFLLQSSFSHVPGFAGWYEARRAEMGTDRAMGFFLRLRNLSQKAGPVSYVGGAKRGGGWTYRFIHGAEAVPDELRGRDIVAACAEQLRKVAAVVAGCADAFPFAACPVAAFTPPGMVHLRYTMEDAETAVGLPAGYTDVLGIDLEVKLRYLARELEPLDRDTLGRMIVSDFRDDDGPLAIAEAADGGLVDDVARLVGRGGVEGGEMRNLFLHAMAARIEAFDQASGRGAGLAGVAED